MVAAVVVQVVQVLILDLVIILNQLIVMVVLEFKYL
jgi:hypothetical protein